MDHVHENKCPCILKTNSKASNGENKIIGNCRSYQQKDAKRSKTDATQPSHNLARLQKSF